jgi:hypothetical protein
MRRVAATVVWVVLLPGAATAQDGSHSIEALTMAARFSDEVLSDLYGTHVVLGTRYVYGQQRWSIAGELGWRSPGGTTSAFGFDSELRVVHIAALAHIPVWRDDTPDAGWTVRAGGGVLHQRLRERVDLAGEMLKASEGATGFLVTGVVRRRLGSSWGVLGEGRFTRLTAPEPAPGVTGTSLGSFEVGGGVWLAFR